MHTFCLVIDKKENDLTASKYFMDWLKGVVEFLLPHNTLTTNLPQQAAIFLLPQHVQLHRYPQIRLSLAIIMTLLQLLY